MIKMSKRTISINFSIILFLLATGPLLQVSAGVKPLAYSNRIHSPVGYGAHGAIVDTSLTIADMLQYALEDEYLAYAECTAFISEFGEQPIYRDMVSLEEVYIGKLKELHAQLAMTPSPDTSKDYMFVPSTPQAAAEQRIQAEMENLAMYVYFLTFPLPAEIEDVFKRLREGSEHQFVAFVSQAQNVQ
jgi:hypothetical protein